MPNDEILRPPAPAATGPDTLERWDDRAREAAEVGLELDTYHQKPPSGMGMHLQPFDPEPLALTLEHKGLIWIRLLLLERRAEGRSCLLGPYPDRRSAELTLAALLERAAIPFAKVDRISA